MYVKVLTKALSFVILMKKTGAVAEKVLGFEDNQK
jgi:hypothetical protein